MPRHITDTTFISPQPGRVLTWNADGTIGTSLFVVNAGSGSATVIVTGDVSPENVVSANTGSFYIRMQGTGSLPSALYIKASGSGATGWVPASAPPIAEVSGSTAEENAFASGALIVIRTDLL